MCNLRRNLGTFLKYFETQMAVCSIFLSPLAIIILYLCIYIYVYNISLFLLEWPKVPVQETTPAPRGVFGEGKTCAIATSMMPTI